MAHIPTHQTASSRPARLVRAVALAPALLAAPAALAACESSTEPGTGPSRIGFTYVGTGAEGTIQGTYSAESDFVVGRSQLTQTFAIGHRYAAAVGVISNVARSAGLSDNTSLTIPRLTVGSVSIDPACETDYCAEVFLGLELPSAEGSQAKYSCSLQAGTLRITAISDMRARGDFSGTGVCIGAPGTEDLEEFRITGGTFDVKVIEAAG